MKNIKLDNIKKSIEDVRPKIKKKVVKSTFRRENSIIKPIAPGYSSTENGVLIPQKSEIKPIIPPGKLQAGILSAQKNINKTIQSIADIFNEELTVSEIELTLGFDAKGNFLGFGAGANFSIKVKVRPNK